MSDTDLVVRPAVVPATDPDIPWLIPWTEESFAKAHGPGAMEVTASQVPALFGESRFASRYAMAAHISGQVPLPEPVHSRIRAGKRLERVAVDWLFEEHGLDVRQVWGYCRHPIVPLIASPDAVGERILVEIKTVTPRVFEERWSDGPPMDVQIQTQAQFACLEDWSDWTGRIVVQVVGDWTYDIQMFETAPHAGAIKKIEAEVLNLIAMLAGGEMPAPDDQHPTTANALFSLFVAKKDLIESIDDPEAIRRFEQLMQGRADEAAGNKAVTAAKLWFLSRAKGAGVLALPDGSRIVLKTSNVKKKVIEASKMTRFKLIAATGEPTAQDEEE